MFAMNTHGQLSPESTIYKCTGRLPLKNVDPCIEVLGARIVCARMALDRSSTDTRLFGATLETWNQILFVESDQVDDRCGLYYELVVASRLSAALALKKIELRRFPTRPIFEGVSGTSGKRYSPATSRLKNLILQPIEVVLARLAARKQV